MNQHLEDLADRWIPKKSNLPVEDIGGSPEEKDPKVIVSPKEFVGAAARSNKLNIVVEGKTDVKVYEQLIAKIGIKNIDCYYAGNRDEVFKVYCEVKKKRGLLPRVAFIADQDSWVFLTESEKPPKGYETIDKTDIIWTEGYSIENDLYIEGRLTSFVDEKSRYDDTLDAICTWYAFEVVNWNRIQNLPVAKHLEQIVSPGCSNLKPELLEKTPGKRI